MKRNTQRATRIAEAAFGLKAHSGWAALVVLGSIGGDLQVLERSRLELVAEADKHWAKQPYHAAERLPPAEARQVVKRGVAAATRIAGREMQQAVKRVRERGFEVRTCSLLVGEPMPNWSTGEILAVHFRMHKAEGTLFRDVLAQAASFCGLRLLAIPEKVLSQRAVAELGIPPVLLTQQISALGKCVGPPWGKDQKEAALAALIALKGQS